MRKLVSAGLALLMLLCLLPIVGFTDASDEEKGNGEVIVLEDADREETETEEDPIPEEPFIPEGLDKEIFGTDDRVTVSNTSAYPYSTIALMKASAPCGCRWTASGFMVGRDRMLTAAHCLVCSDHSTWADQITFYFGYRNDKNYAYRYDGKWTAWAGNLFANRKYTTKEDFGCIKFYENVGDRTGWLGYWYDVPDDDISSNTYYTAGYRDGMLKYDYGKIDLLLDDFLYFKMDMVAGNSGGPIFGSDYYAIGINIAGGSMTNVGFRLNKNISERLNALN